MASFAEKLQALESRLQTYDPETALARTLIDAVATKDAAMAVEALKSLGDLYLENGRSTKVTEEFEKATRVYNAALLRCPECQDVADTIKHRLQYTEKMLSRVSSNHYDSSRHRHETNVKVFETNDVTNNVGRIADICLQLEVSYNTDEGDITDLTKTESSYTKTLLRALANGDQLLEEAMMQDIGDLYLEEGRFRSEIAMLNKATAMYEAAMEISKDGTDRKDTLRHRVNYADRVRKVVIKRNITGTLSTGGRKTRARQDVHFIVDPDTLRSYRNHLSEGQRALQQGELETAEKEFASALKEANCGKIYDSGSRLYRLKVEAECLQKLGHVYLERGKVTKAGGDFTKAAALFNAVLARTEDKYQRENIRTVLKETEKLFLHHTAGVDTVPSKYDIDLPHKRVVSEMRETICQRFEVMDRQQSPYHCDNDSDQTKGWKDEEDRTNTMQNICKKISDDRKSLVEMLLAECMEKAGPPPCRHAFIGLGSQATELATPYSDLEFAILIEEGKDSDQNKQYFRTLTHYLHLKVINLGETVVPAMAITSLNDFCSEDPSRDWFYDRNTPRGFAFDGSMPWASKTPLGRSQTKTKPPLELIQTPSRMASLQNADLSLSDDYNLSWVLQHVCYMAGDRALVDDYIVMVTKQQRHSETENAMSVTENIRNVKKQELTAQLLNVKKEVFRLPTISIQNIASFFGVKSGSIWDMIAELRANGHISMENAHHLKVLVAISAELRLRAYLAADSQRESVSTLSQIVPESGSAITSNSTIESVLYLPNREILYRYYYTAYPLKKLVLRADQQQTCLQGENILFDASPYVNGMMHMAVCDFKAAQEEFTKALCNADESDPIKCIKVVKALAEVSMYLGDPNKSITYCQQGQDMAKLAHGTNSKMHFYYFLTTMGNAYLELGKPEEALKCYEKAMETLDVDNAEDEDEYSATLYHNLGIVWDRLGRHRKALGFFERANKLNVSLYGNEGPDIAVTLENLGSCWSDMGDEQKAINYLEKALGIYKRAYGYDAAHPNIAMALSNIGKCYKGLGDNKNATDFFEHSLKMNKRIYGNDTPHPVTAGGLFNLGSCQEESETGHKRTFVFYEKALKMYKTLFGHDVAHPLIAVTILGIGRTWQALGDQSRAIAFIKAALKMFKTVHGQDAKHQDIASTLLSLGNCLNSIGDHEAATSTLLSSLRMMISVHGEDALHRDIANTLDKLGGAYGSKGDHATSVVYHTKAVDMYRLICGDNGAQNLLYKSLYNLGKALCDLGGYHRAIDVCEESLKISRNVHGQEAAHPDMSKALNTLGVAWNFLGYYEKAIGFFQQTLNMNKAIHGADAAHKDIVLALSNLGNAHDSLGKNKQAIAFYEQALDMSKRIHGCDADHKAIARLLDNLGSSYSDLYDRKAIRFYEQALEMRQRMHGRESAHPDIAGSLYNLGLIWKDLGHDNEAIQYLEQALALHRQMYENNLPCPHLVELLNTLGKLFSSLGNKSKAIDLFQESLVISKHMYGEETAHENVFVALDNLGNIWKDLGDHRKAVEFYERGLNVKERLYGQGAVHPDISASLNNLGIAWGTLNDYHRAVQFFKSSLQMTRLLYGENTAHPHTQQCLLNLSKAWECLGDQRKAAKYYGRAVKMAFRLKNAESD